MRDLLIVAAGVSAAVAILVAVGRHRPVRRAPWYLMAAGAGLWAFGDLLWVWYDHVLGVEPFPSGADVAYLAAYPLLALGLYQLSRRPGGGGDRSALLDALTVATGVTLVLWVFFIQPTWTAASGTMFERVVSVAYPIADVVIITQLAHLASARARRSPTVTLLLAAAGVMLCADLLFQAAAYAPWLDMNMALIDPLWTGFYVLWGAAALHPSMPATSAAVPPATHPLTVRRVVFLAASVFILPGLIITEMALGLPTHTTAVSIASVFTIVLVLHRMVGLVWRMRDQADDLARLADTDPLTGLENSRRFGRRIAELIDPDGEPGSGPSLLLVAVERFAEINDTLGLRTGEELLRAVGARLADETGHDGVVARLSGESFGVLLPRVGSGAHAAERAHDVLSAFAEPFVLAELTVTVDVVIGVAVAPDDAGTAEEVLQRADVAVSAAKERGDRVGRYAEQRENGGAFTPLLMTELSAAIASGQVLLHFQPQVEIATGRVIGVEALVRWQHPEHGLLSPAAFVPAAERTGLIRELTAFVLDTALDQVASWRADGHDLMVSVNLSARNLLDPHFVEEVRSALVRRGVPAEALELEVTETMAMVDPNRSVEVLGALAGLGVTLSVDDYGTGYSSLAYLQRLPVHRLKIDRSFVAGVIDSSASAAIVRSTIELARHLGLDVVAEGVEDDDVLLALGEMRCWAAQGFGLGRPVPAADIPALVHRIEHRVPGLAMHVPAPRTPARR